jgi:hypothetical protein
MADAKIISNYGVHFELLVNLGKPELERRQAAILKLAEAVWNPSRLDRMLAGEPA